MNGPLEGRLERDPMPEFARLSVVLLPLVVSVSCSTLQPKGAGDGGDGVFRESAADVVNRAPSSMSLPGETKGVNDPASQRTQADYHFALAETYSLQGDSARAAEEYKLTLIYDSSSPQVRVRLAAEYVKQGLVSEALEQAKIAVAADPNFIDGHLLLGGLYSALRVYDDAIKEYRLVQTISPENAEAPLFVGAILAEQKKYAEASEQFEKLGKGANNVNAHVAWYYLGRVRLEEDKEKNAARAEAAFERSLALRPSYTEATAALGSLYESSGRKEKALHLFENFQEKFGPSSVIAEDLSRLYIENKDYTRAFEQLAIMESGDPTDINIKAKMSFILIEQQKYQEAVTRLEGILAIEPSSDKIRFYLGAVFEELKDYKSAVTHFEKVPIGSSYYAESVVHSAYLYKVLGDYGKAIATVTAGIKAKDDHAPFYALYASLLDDTKQYDKAIEMLKGAVARLPDQPQLYFFLGNMLDHVGDRAGGITAMKKVLELDKDHVQALNFLAYTYADGGNDLVAAESMARRALELQPEDGYILDTLGWVLFKRGQLGESIRTLEAAYKIQPNEAVIAEHLGDAYYQNQMPEKAKKLYLRAVENESNVATLEKIRSKIAAINKQVQAAGLGDESRKPASAH